MNGVMVMRSHRFTTNHETEILELKLQEKYHAVAVAMADDYFADTRRPVN